jgi:lipase
MSSSTPVVFIHGFIGSLDVANFEPPHAAPDLLGYGEEQSAPFEAITLSGQVDYLRAFIDTHYEGKLVDVVGHSVGGAIAMLFAHAHPDYVRRIVNIEGNFTLGDAFWSGSVGRMSHEEAEAMLGQFRADPLGWISHSVVAPTSNIAETAARWLNYQPASTLRAMGQSVVATTGDPHYLTALREVFDRHPVYLLSGERSREGWNIPDWALERSVEHQILANTGHLMMVDAPVAFASALKRFLADSVAD